MAYLHEQSENMADFSGLGWTGYKCCGIGPLRRCVGTAGHEVITRGALGTGVIPFTVAGRPLSRALSSVDQNLIITANVDVDFGSNCQGLTSAFTPSEQAKHALRAYQWTSTPTALSDIRTEFYSQHRGIISEPNPAEKMRRIGRLLHLIQDAYSPAHSDRDSARSWCVRYVRNYGTATRFLYPREHNVPSDNRDLVATASSAAAVRQATDVSRRYLQIVCKLLHGTTAPDPVAVVEGTTELTRFVAEVFRQCTP